MIDQKNKLLIEKKFEVWMLNVSKNQTFSVVQGNG